MEPTKKTSVTQLPTHVYCIMVFVLLSSAGFASADFQQDREECASQLVGLSPCLTYVSGNSKSPTPDCCSGFKGVVEKSAKCLCILIKDRDDPNLNIKINASLAATLPSICHAPANVTNCIAILHLSPSSPDAKVFASFANMTQAINSAPIASGNSNGTSSGSKSEEKSHASDLQRPKQRLGADMICVMLIWAIAITSFVF